MQTDDSLIYVKALVLALLVFLAAGGFYGCRNRETTTTGAEVHPDLRLIPFRKGDQWGFSDQNKKLIIKAKYDSADPFSEGLARVVRNNKYGFIDKAGKEVTAFKY